MDAQCIECGKRQKVKPSRAKTFRFCSYACRGRWRSKHWTRGNNPRWTGGPRLKDCQYCGKEFGMNPTEAISTFRKRKFCCKDCADRGGFRYSGKEHPNYRENARRKNRSHSYAKWARQVISRDNATCQHCGATGIELHAHHIKSYQDHPELRYDVSNGLTLCYICHWKEHSAGNANGVNSGKLLTDNAEDNPEPSLGGNIQEGVTTRGRAYRRWEGACHWCSTFLSKRLSDVTGKAHIFCSKYCMGKHRAATRTWRPVTDMHIPPTAVISSTSAPRESD